MNLAATLLVFRVTDSFDPFRCRNIQLEVRPELVPSTAHCIHPCLQDLQDRLLQQILGTSGQSAEAELLLSKPDLCVQIYVANTAPSAASWDTSTMENLHMQTRCWLQTASSHSVWPERCDTWIRERTSKNEVLPWSPQRSRYHIEQ